MKAHRGGSAVYCDETDDMAGRDLARWLQEAALRDAAAKEQKISASEDVPAHIHHRDHGGISEATRRALLLALAGLAGLQYLFIDVEVKILTLRSLIVFVFL